MSQSAHPNDLGIFFQRGRSLKLEKGEVILNSNIHQQGVYLIEKGFVKVYSISNRGEQYLHIIYKPGDIFPLTWALRDSRHRLFYETISSFQCRVVPKNDFLDFVQHDAPSAYLLLEQVTDQLDVHIRRIESLQHRHANERVAYRLITLARRFGEKHGDKIEINAPITHQLIADSINLTRESVSREIEKLERQDIIGYTNYKIVIKSLEKLISEFD